MVKKGVLLILLAGSVLFSCNGNSNLIKHESYTSDQIPIYKPKIHHIFPHDSNAFTQGLFYAEGFLYESTGSKGKSSLRKVDIKTGKIVQKINLAADIFGEGITLCNDKIILLTWQNKKGLVYDKNSFQMINEFSYQTEGWGITFNGEHLVMSDGTDVLYYLNPEDYNVVRKVNVSAAGKAVKNINELEYINGKIYANIWKTKQIVIIQPDGNVVSWLDLTGILSDGECSGKIDELNGIAYNAAKDRVYVTGKNWCKLFELEVIPSAVADGITSKRNF